ncbi:MAG: hypothetical protein O2909_05060, partial [Chloroflexi bacterium]|nr:hypothetical protein [Chloroflexota bacterium]
EQEDEEPTAREINHHIFTKSRRCPSWVEWIPGYSPKEHREMMDRQRLLEFQAKREDDWQKFQKQMVADDKKWREVQEIQAETRHKKELQTIKDINRTQMLVMGGLVTLVFVLVTLLGGAIEANWFPKWFGIFK